MRDLHFAPRLHPSRPHRPALPESSPDKFKLTHYPGLVELFAPTERSAVRDA
jgi:hypothetical protein